MRRILTFLFIALSVWTASGQNFLKTAEDTAFVLDHVYYPQMQLKLSVDFNTRDFSLSPARQTKYSDIDSLKKLIAAEPFKADHYMALNAAYGEFHRDKDADTALRKATDLYLADLMKNPADTHAVRALAGIYLRLMDWQLALAYHNELIRLAPASAAGYTGLAMISVMSYDYDEAVNLMQKAIELEPGSIDNYCQMANVMMMKSIFDLNTLDSAAVDSLSYRNIINTAFLKEAIRKHPENLSLQALYEALEFSGIMYQCFIDNADQFTGRGDTIRFVLSGEISEALVVTENKMKAYVQKDFKTKIFPYNVLMLIELLRNNTDGALQWFNKGIRFNKRSQNLYENIVGICAITAKKDEAFKLQLRLDSIHPVFNNYFMTAYFYYLEKNLEQAEKWTRLALEKEPRNFYPLMGMAAINARKMKFPDAAHYLDKAAGISPQHPDVKLLMGILYLFDNSPMMARSAFLEIQKSPDAMNEVQELLDRFWP